jgi:hypothetical protein
MEKSCSSETSVDFQRTTPHYIAEDITVQKKHTEWNRKERGYLGYKA